MLSVVMTQVCLTFDFSPKLRRAGIARINIGGSLTSICANVILVRLLFAPLCNRQKLEEIPPHHFFHNLAQNGESPSRENGGI